MSRRGAMTDAPVLVLGYANLDLVAFVSDLPTPGGRVTASRIDSSPGGMAANCACNLAVLGSRPIFFGNVGADPFGELLLAEFARYGVDSRQVTRHSRTTKALVLVTEGGERAIVSEPTPYQPEALRRYLEEYDGPPSLLYVDGYHLVVARAELASARAKGFTIYCDLDGAPDTYPRTAVLEALALVDIVQWNEAVVAALFPGLSPAAARGQLPETVRSVIFTRGANDVLAYQGEAAVVVPVPQVDDAVDATGAGDAFAAAMLDALRRGEAFATAVERAARVAAEVVRHRGARLPWPSGAGRSSQGC